MPELKYVIYRCSSCRSVQASPLRYSTKRCPYCGHLNRLRGVEALAYAPTAADASAAVAKIKEVEGASAAGSTLAPAAAERPGKGRRRPP